MNNFKTTEAWVEEAKQCFGEDLVLNEESMQKSLVDSYQRETNSWIIKLLSVFGGVFAFGSFFSFIAMSNLFDKPYFSLFVGLVMIVFSNIISRTLHHLVMDTVILCTYFTGYFLIGLGLNKIVGYHWSDDAIASATLLIALASFLFSSRPMIIFFSVLIFEGAAFSFILIHDAYDFMHVFFAVNVVLFFVLMTKESFFITTGNFLKHRYNELRNAILISLWLANYAWMILSSLSSSQHNHIVLTHTWISSIAGILPLVWLLFDLGKRLQLKSPLHQWLMVIAVILFLVPTIYYPAIAMSLMILLFSYRIRLWLGVYAGALGLVFFIGQFYYDLHVTLLQKSYMMLGAGIAILVLLLLTRKKLFSHEEI